MVRELARHGLVQSHHDQNDPEVGGEELEEQDDLVVGVGEAPVQGEVRDGGPGPAGQPEQGLGHQRQDKEEVQLIIN